MSKGVPGRKAEGAASSLRLGAEPSGGAANGGRPECGSGGG